MSHQQVLARLCQGPASGQELAKLLGISRSAVWKRIQALRDAGVMINAQAGQGYRLAYALQLLDSAIIKSELSTTATEQLAGIDLRFEIDSTNALALNSPVPTSGCKVFLCERQNAGRGRRGRQWQSPLAAHIYLSVSRRFDGGIAALQGLSLAVAVAVAQALLHLGFAGIGVKWPNDLYANGRKLGGILIELGGDVSGPMRVVIGLGLNVAMPPASAAEIDQPWCDLTQLNGGTAPSRNAVIAALLNHLLPALVQFESHGFCAFHDAWQGLDILAGERVSLQENGRALIGIARGVALDGALRVDYDGIERRHHAGEVSTCRL